VEQNSDVTHVSAEGSGGNNTVISNALTRNQGSKGSATTGQESDINKKTSPDVLTNGVSNTVFNPVRQNLKELAPQKSEILELFSIHGSWFQALVVHKSGRVFLWEVPAGRSFHLLDLPSEVSAIAFHRERGLIAFASATEVGVLDANSGRETARLRRLKTRVASLVFQPDGAAIVAGGTDGEVYRWKFEEEKSAPTVREEAKSLERYFGHSNVVSAVAYHPVGRVFFSADWSGVLSAWLPYDSDRFKGVYDENLFSTRAFSDRASRMRAGRSSESSIESLALSADGEALLVASQDGSLEWWRVRGFSLAASVAAHRGLVYDLAFAPSGKRAVSVGRDGKLKLWSLSEQLDSETAQTEFKLVREKEFETLGGARVSFLDESTLIVADKTGKVSTLTL
jgi:WD40 repeat protein